MKKIALSILRGGIAYNILHNDFYRILRERSEVLLLTPAAGDPRFIKEFGGHPNVRIIALPKYSWTPADRFMNNLHRLLIWNPSVDIQFRYGFLETHRMRSAFVYYLTKAIFVPLSKISILRRFVRWLDYTFAQRQAVGELEELLRREQPDCVVATSVAGDEDAALLKAAAKCAVPTAAAFKSWDNPSKFSLRAKSDVLMVWNEYMRDCALKFQGYGPGEVAVVGMPQYDAFVDPKNKLGYEDFCKIFGLDASRKTILFGSEGKYSPHDAEVAEMIAEMMMRDEFMTPCQLLIRPHYGHPGDEKKFTRFIGKPHVAIDLFCSKSRVLKDEWDYSREFAGRFINSLYHAAVVVQTCSTLTLDAAALDRPIVSIAFDGVEKLPYEKSVARFYDKEYFSAALVTGATHKVYSKDALREAINAYLKDPLRDGAGRQALRERFCGALDGKSGQRLAEAVLGMNMQHILPPRS